MSSHVTIKKNLIIFHRPGDWIKIYTKILQDFGQGMAVRTRLRRELGFSYRHHRGLVPTDHQYQDGPKMMHYEDQIHVDFYNEAAQSWFQLRYL
jgi:hypothetical protein